MTLKSNLEKYQTLSKILAAAISDLFPKAQLVHASASRRGFYADFVFKDPLMPQQIAYVEDRMHLLQKNNDIERLDMVADNLALYLREKGQVMRSHFLRPWGGDVVPVFKIGSFCDLSDQGFDTSSFRENFKLQIASEKRFVHFRGRDEEVTRIEGFIGKHKGIQDHIALGVEEQLFVAQPLASDFFQEGYEFIWHPRGARLRRELRVFAEKAYERAGFGLVETEGELLDYLKAYPTPGGIAQWYLESNENFSNGLLESALTLSDRALKAGGISDAEFLLQFIVKTINMLELKWRPYFVRSTKRSGKEGASLCEDYLRSAAEKLGLECDLQFTQAKKSLSARIELKIEDAFGFEWTGAYLQMSPFEEGFLFELSLFNSLERIVGLILEQKQKTLHQMESHLAALNKAKND